MHTRFRSRIGPHAFCRGFRRRTGTDVDDTARAALQNMWQGGTAGDYCRLQIDSKHGVPAVDVARLERLPAKSAGNIDQYIDAAVVARDLDHSRLCGICPGEVDAPEQQLRGREFLLQCG